MGTVLNRVCTLYNSLNMFKHLKFAESPFKALRI